MSVFGNHGLARLACLGVAMAGACSVGVRRDLGKATPSQVVNEDQCGLQDYFDALVLGNGKPPVQLSSEIIESASAGQVLGGRSTHVVSGEPSRAMLRRLLAENWKLVPPEVDVADSVEIRVRWAELAASRWVVSDEQWELRAGGKSYAMAFHPCLTNFLFGQQLYALRREVLGLPPVRPPLAPLAPVASPDAGAR